MYVWRQTYKPQANLSSADQHRGTGGGGGGGGGFYCTLCKTWFLHVCQLVFFQPSSLPSPFSPFSPLPPSPHSPLSPLPPPLSPFSASPLSPLSPLSLSPPLSPFPSSSLRHDSKVLNYRVTADRRRRTYYVNQNSQFSSVPELIAHYSTCALNETTGTKLVTPVGHSPVGHDDLYVRMEPPGQWWEGVWLNIQCTCIICLRCTIFTD